MAKAIKYIAIKSALVLWPAQKISHLSPSHFSFPVERKSGNRIENWTLNCIVHLLIKDFFLPHLLHTVFIFSLVYVYMPCVCVPYSVRENNFLRMVIDLPFTFSLISPCQTLSTHCKPIHRHRYNIIVGIMIIVFHFWTKLFFPSSFAFSLPLLYCLNRMLLYVKRQ